MAQAEGETQPWNVFREKPSLLPRGCLCVLLLEAQGLFQEGPEGAQLQPARAGGLVGLWKPLPHTGPKLPALSSSLEPCRGGAFVLPVALSRRGGGCWGTSSQAASRPVTC